MYILCIYYVYIMYITYIHNIFCLYIMAYYGTQPPNISILCLKPDKNHQCGQPKSGDWSTTTVVWCSAVVAVVVV